MGERTLTPGWTGGAKEGFKEKEVFGLGLEG